MKTKYEIAVIGTGPAGLSAALNCHSRNKDFVLIGPLEGSFKVKSSQKIDNYLGFYGISGEDLNKAFINSIEKLKFSLIDNLAKSVYKLPDGFFIELKDASMIEAKSVIVATGVNVEKRIKNEDVFLGKGISYCATCDSLLYKNKSVVVIGYNQESIEEARFLATVTKSIIFVNMTNLDLEFDQDIKLLKDRPLEFLGNEKAEKLLLENTELEADGFFIIRDSSGVADLIPGIELEKNHIKVDKSYETNLKGLFACGDITGLPYQIAKASGQGNLAGLGASKYIESLKNKTAKAD